MHRVGRIPKSFGTFAAIACIALLLAVSAALAENTASKRAAAPPPSLDTTASDLSPAALGENIGPRDKSAADKPDLTIPDSIKFGNRTLRFDTDRKAVDSIPRVGLDATDPAVLPSHRDQDLPPSYFGLTLTTPTR
jgi:hypothetical protein